MAKFLVILIASAALANAQVSATPEQIEERFRLLESRILQLEAELAAVKGEEVPEPAPEQPTVALTALTPLEEPEPLPMAEVIPTEGTASDETYSSEVRMPLCGLHGLPLQQA